MDIEIPLDDSILHQEPTPRLPDRVVKEQGGVGGGLDKRGSIRPKDKVHRTPMHLFFYLPGTDHPAMREGVQP